MARLSQRRIFNLPTTLGIIWTILTISSCGAYVIFGAQSSIDLDFVPLEMSHRVIRRQTSLGNQSNKLRTNVNLQKASKNSASNLPELLDGEQFVNHTDIALEMANNTQITVVEDHHTYYNSTIILEEEKSSYYWVNLDQMEQVILHEMLSKSYRKASTLMLSFDFPFYGHVVRNITVATGGFIYTGDYMHSWLASTQYIAPLMANFDTTLGDSSHVKYADNGTHFVVQWEDVVLQDMPDSGTFTFQVMLKNTGDIVFSYKKVPVSIHLINENNHPVKVGLSDAYIIERAFFFLKKVIYEYHRIEIKKDTIANATSVYLTALPNCLSQKTCEKCTTSVTTLTCEWCEQAKRCSDGMDRHRQDWVIKGCEKQLNDRTCAQPATVEPVYTARVSDSLENTSSPSNENSIPLLGDFVTTVIPLWPSGSIPSETGVLHDSHSSSAGLTDKKVESYSSITPAGIVAVLLVVVLLLALGIWVLYAYRNPHTTSGQLIIRYRPSQWQWAKGETPYTAATVHM